VDKATGVLNLGTRWWMVVFRVPAAFIPREALSGTHLKLVEPQICSAHGDEDRNTNGPIGN